MKMLKIPAKVRSFVKKNIRVLSVLAPKLAWTPEDQEAWMGSENLSDGTAPLFAHCTDSDLRLKGLTHHTLILSGTGEGENMLTLYSMNRNGGNVMVEDSVISPDLTKAALLTALKAK